MVIRVHRWVIWWFCLGVVGGAIVLPNIVLRNLTRTQESVLLWFGVVHWMFGGFVCWAWEGVKLARDRKTLSPTVKHLELVTEPEQNVLSELMAHHDRPISPRHTRLRQEILTIYFLRHGGHHT